MSKNVFVCSIYACVCSCVFTESRRGHRMSCCHSPLYAPGTEFLTELSTRLASQWHPGIFLSLPIPSRRLWAFLVMPCISCSFWGALPSSPHAVWWGLLPPTIPPTPEKQSCIGHYINIDGIYTLGPLFNAKNQLESHIHKDTYSITLSVEVAIRDGIAGSIHQAVFITTECCSMFKRLRDGKLELSSWFESSERFCCMRNTRFPEVCT